MYAGVHSTSWFAARSCGRSSSTEMNQSSERRKIRGVSQHQQAALAEIADQLVCRLDRGKPVQPAVVVVEASGLIHGRQHVEAVHLRELEVLAAAAGRDVDDARALVERDLVPRDHVVLHLSRGEIVERARVAPADELLSALSLAERLVGVTRDGNPLAVLPAPVLGVGLDRRCDVRRQRPRRRRPDHE